MNQLWNKMPEDINGESFVQWKLNQMEKYFEWIINVVHLKRKILVPDGCVGTFHVFVWDITLNALGI